MNKTDPNTRPHVLCVVGWWPEGKSVAGTFIREHILAISKTCSVVVVHAKVLKGEKPWPYRVVQKKKMDGMTVCSITIGTPIRRFGLFGYLVRRAFKELVNELHSEQPFDLMHIHVRDEVTEHAAKVAGSLDLPIVVTEHASHYHLGILALPPDKQKAERASIRKWFANDRIARVMPVSNNLANILRDDFGVREERIDVVPNIAAPVFALSDRRPEQPFRIMLAAVWRPPKDPDVFIDALATIPSNVLKDTIIDWVGYGPFMDSIRSKCSSKLPYLDIRFPGMLTKEHMAQHMQAAHLFVLPTTTENLPCVILESLCCGTPVLSMEINGIPEMVNSSNGILISSRDVRAMANAIVKVLEDPEQFDRKAIANAASIRYSQGPVSKRIMANYRSAMRMRRN